MTLEQKELWKKKERDEFEFLDSIDVRKYLINGMEVTECMNKIKEDHNKEYCEKYNDDYGFFNYTGTDDFLEYIRKRYPDINYNESITYYIYNPN